MVTFWVEKAWLRLVLLGALLSGCASPRLPQITTAPTLAKATATAQPVETATHVATATAAPDCAAIERLAIDSPEAQQIVEEFVSDFRRQQPTEYMGMSILHGVDRWGEWAVVQGSVSGEGKDVIVARQTPQGYRLAGRFTITAPLRSYDVPPESIVLQYFAKNLPKAPAALFACLEQSWLVGPPPEASTQTVAPPPEAHKLAFIAGQADRMEIYTVETDTVHQNCLVSERMLLIGLDTSVDGKQLVFWGCPGSMSADCDIGAEPDILTVDWQGLALRWLTGSPGSDIDPNWSPAGQIAFSSDRSGSFQIYVMNGDGSDPHRLTDRPGENRRPRWSPDGRWIAYHHTEMGATQIEVISADGQLAGTAISGTEPAWSPDSQRLAFMCFTAQQLDVCTARFDGSDKKTLTEGPPSDEHSAAWSPDGKWLAFVSNRGNDVDVYKLCATCAAGMQWVRLTDQPQPAVGPVWSPDGSQVAFVSAGDLWVVNADRSGLTYLASDVTGLPVWQPQGRHDPGR